MSRTPSNMLPLGTKAPQFVLNDTVSDGLLSLADLTGTSATVILFICNHCPYVKHVNNELIHVAEDYLPKGVKFAAINSNDITAYPEDAPDKMKQTALHLGYPFPYLYDESQEVARAYDAACTPDLFVFDKAMKLVYRGQLDDSRPGNGIPVTGRDLRQALDALIEGRVVSPNQRPSIGCNIKWKSID